MYVRLVDGRRDDELVGDVFGDKLVSFFLVYDYFKIFV